MADFVYCWLRRDLRLDDNTALNAALESGLPVQPVFIFDKHILDPLPEQDARVSFIHQRLREIDSDLRQFGASLRVHYGKPEELWKELSTESGCQGLYTNLDYEPAARKRDGAVRDLLHSQGQRFEIFKDQVIFERDEVVKPSDAKPYVVFTPYSRRWKARFEEEKPVVRPLPSKPNFCPDPGIEMPTLESMGFRQSSIPIPPSDVADELIAEYGKQRDFPDRDGTSKLGIHLRFGTISIRRLALRAAELDEVYLNELIWREFYQQILYHFPHVVGNAFRPAYDRIPWLNDEAQFEAWCQGKTGFPLVDAGMRQLVETGWMHNRVRMVVASFLTKHLLIDWRWGEAFFAEHLLDFELASNNGGWQWASGSGCDAAPYFRVFNPTSQAKKFDPKAAYMKHWVPELLTGDYPAPIVDHPMARQRAIDTYKEALKG